LYKTDLVVVDSKEKRMYFRIAKIIALGSTAGLLQEERTEENDYRKEDDLLYLFDCDKVVFLTDKASIEKGDIVWFSIVKPCGGEETVDAIKKPFFDD